MRGPKRRRRRLAYILITVWSALGFPLAFRKGAFGMKVAWIGAKLTAHDDKVVARAKEDILDELSQDIEEATARNFTTKAVLRSLWPAERRTWRPSSGSGALFSRNSGRP